MLLSESYKRCDLGSLKAVTYGTEPMPESTLLRFNKIFPHIKMLQTYGMSEVGVLKSKSKDSGSLWVKIGGDGVETQVVDGILQVKTASALLGYLNAPNPITEDGWFVTGDSVMTAFAVQSAISQLDFGQRTPLATGLDSTIAPARSNGFSWTVHIVHNWHTRVTQAF